MQQLHLFLLRHSIARMQRKRKPVCRQKFYKDLTKILKDFTRVKKKKIRNSQEKQEKVISVLPILCN